MHTNDEHGRLVFDDGKYNKYSGMQGLAEVLNKDFDRDLLLSAGDLIQGLPLSDSDKGLTISKVAKEMKYQAVAIGNHWIWLWFRTYVQHWKTNCWNAIFIS
nr:hypothetical protein [Mycoplasmopsis bovis]